MNKSMADMLLRWDVVCGGGTGVKMRMLEEQQDFAMTSIEFCTHLFSLSSYKRIYTPHTLFPL